MDVDHPHGLVYPNGLLAALPVLHPPPDNDPRSTNTNTPHHHHNHPRPRPRTRSPRHTASPPIRALSAPQFADLHLQHTLAHPPDNTLFPFLHGLEGDNHAQNTFFASSFANNTTTNSNANQRHHYQHQHQHGAEPPPRITPRVPHYRGLVWVVCEDDLERERDWASLRVLRRKPVGPASTATATANANANASTNAAGGIAGEDDTDHNPHAPSSSDSSSSASSSSSDSSSLYDDEDEDLDLDLDLDPAHAHAHGQPERGVDTDAQDLLLMLEATNEAAVAAKAAAVAVAAKDLDTDKGAHEEKEKERERMGYRDRPLAELDLDTDPDEEDADAEEDEDGSHTSASPAQARSPSTQTQTQPQVISLEEVFTVNTGNAKGAQNYDGAHMHPVAHRPALVLAPPVAVPAVGVGAGVSGGKGLGIDTNAIANGHAVSSIANGSAVSLYANGHANSNSNGNGGTTTTTNATANAQITTTTTHATHTSLSPLTFAQLSPSSPLSATSASASTSSSPSSSVSSSSSFVDSPPHSVSVSPSASVSASPSLTGSPSMSGDTEGEGEGEWSPATSISHIAGSPLSKEVDVDVDANAELGGEGEGGQGRPMSLLEIELDAKRVGGSRSRQESAHPHEHEHGHGQRLPQQSHSQSQSQLEHQEPIPTTSPASPSSPLPLPLPLPLSSSSPPPSSSLLPLPLPLPLPTTPSQTRADTQTKPKPKQRPPTDPTKPPLLTSTFRPKELLRRVKGQGRKHGHGHGHGHRGQHHREKGRLRVDVGGNGNGNGVVGREGEGEGEQDEDEEVDVDEEDGRWEFVPARVPDGISLRNFGIQVPIYATLSDIVIYSPHGATPAALALARRFRAAIKAKRAERLRAAGLDDESIRSAERALKARDMVQSKLDMMEREGSGDSGSSGSNFGPVYEDDNTGQQQQQQTPELQMQKDTAMHPHIAALHRRRAEFLEYNVFVLDADEDEMRRAMPHMMMRVCGAGVPGGLGLGLGVNVEASAVGSVATATATATATIFGADTALMDGGAHTDRSDGHVIELKREEEEEAAEARRVRMEAEAEGMGMVVDTMEAGVDVDAMDVDEVVDIVAAAASHVAAEQAHDEKTEEKNSTKEDEEEEDILPNTVDFALREREEMRDLTKASEIISLPPITSASARGQTKAPVEYSDLGPPSVWDPRVGQVYLGNSGDVPLTPDVPTQFRHAASVARAAAAATTTTDANAEENAKWNWKTLTRHLRGVDGLMKEYDGELGLEYQHGFEEEDAEGALPADDPFNYAATNDPAHGFGYDICVECHDLAPFPSAAHLRAAEEHLGMLDVMWRERWERAWSARLVRLCAGKSAEEQARIRNMHAPPTPPRPPPHANAVIHLPFPSSPPNSQGTMVALMPVVRFLEKWIQPVPVPVIAPPPPPPPVAPVQESQRATSPPATTGGAGSRRWSSVTALMPSFPVFPGSGSSSSSNTNKAAPTPPPSSPLPPAPARMRSMTSPSSSMSHHPPTPVQARSRPLKILLYSSDGYTESSVPALCLLMAIKSLMLPEAYLELQVEKRRSFFVYQSDLGLLRRVENRLREEREREKEKERERERERERLATGVYLSSSSSSTGGGSINANGKRTAGGPVVVPARGGYWSGSSSSAGNANSNQNPGATSNPIPSAFTGRPAAKSVSFAHVPGYMQQQSSSHQVATNSISAASSASSPLMAQLVPHSRVVSSQQSTSASQFSQKPQFEFGSLPATPPAGMTTTQQPQQQPPMMGVAKGRPRASTSPWLPSLFGGDHQSWFNDPRFDGSFPSRVLPFLYLGNLNHASNVYMLHALGITHVVSVGECALVPPPHHMSMHSGAGDACARPGPGAHFVPGKGPGGHGSLWIEEREGRIKVLDIKGVCDDGIDTLEPQLEPICDWIDKARQEGGQVLVHCRVGVSRSATVTIAYVMKHLNLPLVDAYLIVRSRRLSVLIQPNMRLLYNLCGWEIKLAKERAGGDERKLKKELARTLTWPYLSKEVHALNEKYLH